MAPLSWRHHTLLQARLSRGPLSERDFHAVFAAVSGKNPGAAACSASHSARFSFPPYSPSRAIFQARGSSQRMAPLPWRQRHHTLLQVLLSRGPLVEPDFHAVFAAVSDRDPATPQQLFNDTLLKINKELAYLQFELRACINQYDGMVYYRVVNNIADEESKLGTKYSVPQIAFYKGLLEAIVQEARNDGSITSFDALNVRLDN